MSEDNPFPETHDEDSILRIGINEADLTITIKAANPVMFKTLLTTLVPHWDVTYY